MSHGLRVFVLFAAALAALSTPLRAEVTKVTITNRTPVAEGDAFGPVGPYERLTGTIEFALDPAHPRNARIADIARAQTGADGRVHFTADLSVLQPVDPARGNGALLFEIANRGRKGLLGRFNRAPASNDPTGRADVGDGFLMRAGYTLVWVGWQFDVEPPFLRVEAPAVTGPGPDRVRMSFIVDEGREQVTPADLPRYLPAAENDPTATLSVRDLFWQAGAPIARSRFSVKAVDGRPVIGLQGGFEPGRVYDVDYRGTGGRVAGVGLAAIRDAATAFVHRTDLPVRGRQAYVFGISQSGRFLRQFLHDGFNADEQGRRVFDAVWAHIAGAGQGSFNESWAMPGYSSFPATKFPYTDATERNARGESDGLLAVYTPEQRPRIFYTDTSVEYWGQGRAAALTHTALDGKTDLTLPENVRLYLLAGTQHGEAAFPPAAGPGQQLGNPTPQANVMRALLRSLHDWTANGVAPPDSRYPRLRDGSLAPVANVKFPAIPAVGGDPRKIEGPADAANGHITPLPFLVPQVDADGNEVGGVRVPEQLVPLATTTGWNFRAPRVGNPGTTYPLLGGYVPFARTRAEREARHDPRKAIEERYSGKDEYLQRIRAAADGLVKDRFLLPEDVDDTMRRAARHWDQIARPVETR